MSGNLKTFRIALVMFFILIGGGIVSAQTIKGNVKDSTGEPIIGASIVITGTSQGTITNVDGNFTLPNVQENATIEVT